MSLRWLGMRTFLILICFLVVGGFLVGLVLGALEVSDASIDLICVLLGLLVIGVGAILRWGRRGSPGGES